MKTKLKKYNLKQLLLLLYNLFMGVKNLKIKSYSQHIGTSSSLNWMSLILFIIIVFLPVFVIVSEPLYFTKGQSKSGIIEILFSFKKFGLLLNSILHIGLVTGLSILMSIVIASYLWRIHRKPYVYLRWIFLILVLIPPYFHTLSWNSFFNGINSVLQNLGIQQITMGGFLIDGFIQFMEVLPFGIGITLIGIETVDSELIEAGEMFKSDFSCFLKIVIPIAYPFIILGYGIIFIINFLNYSMPMLFEMNVFSFEIFTEFSTNNVASNAFIVILLILIICILTVCFLQVYLRKDSLLRLWRSKEWKKPFEWPMWFRYLQFAGLIMIVINIVIQMVFLLI